MIGIDLIPPIAGVAAIVTAAYLVYYILSKPVGTDRMRELSDSIYRGAMTFLNEEYRTITVFVIVVMGILLAISQLTGDLPWETALSFLVGAIFSALAGNIGMRIATRANARTAEAVKGHFMDGLRIAFSSGAVMGLSVVGLGIIGVSLFYWTFGTWLDVADEALRSILFSFGFGASSIALFARVGGGIYTKSADVGADIVGKVEEGIPEDDPRNPAAIADNVGDNVGDVAGMGADLFESYVDSIIAAISLALLGLAGASIGVDNFASFGDNVDIYPLIIVAIGVFSSIAAMVLVRGKNAYAALRNGLFGSAIIFAVVAFIATWYLLEAMEPFYAILVGLVDGIVIGLATEYFTSDERRPTQSIARAAQTGPATDIIQGMSVGMFSVFIPIIATAVAMVLAFEFVGFYGVALAAVGMLSTLGMSLANDCYGPVADNAAGIAEMAGMGSDIREKAEALDAVGNTTAAMGKGFAIGSAAITALALVFTFVQSVMDAKGWTIAQITDRIALNQPEVMAGLFVGAMLPFLFSALTMGAVGRAAQKMVDEVRRQFRELGILEGRGEPDYQRCVKIATRGALVEMILPVIVAIAAPIAMGLWDVGALVGLLAGATATGFLLAIYLANAGGAWDNAKKYIEAGNFGGKGSEAHKAAVVGDTVGDPCKDTSGPSLNILIKLMSIVSLVFLPLFL
ncbi:MAG: sodium-translocating pyrophosphatase [Candidatus Thermoplasmatota archaeon]|nr:sodium-translocating pyrophosphatase [Candidatus Thermoplasmatota archaeon]